MKVLTQKSIKITFFVVLFTKLVCVDDNFIKQIVVFKGENGAFKYWNKIMKKNILTRI